LNIVFGLRYHADRPELGESQTDSTLESGRR
jgi:hypothetical protein